MSDQKSDSIEALRRAMPVARMIDYGMQRADAEAAHSFPVNDGDWADILSGMSDAKEAEAAAFETSGNRAAAAGMWHAASASLIFAQLAFNFDSDRKRSLYSRMTKNFESFARLSSIPVHRVRISFGGGELYGWHFRSHSTARAAVVTFGGLSGWATAYRFMAETLRAANIDCLVVDGPGQGESRLFGGVLLSENAPAGFARFIDYVEQNVGSVPVGIWGNSFGGLFAALTSVADDRIRACCINGAPPRCDVPPFRTPTEQMAAMFGKDSLEGLEDKMRALSFNARKPIPCPVLILEGGADPLVPLGTQDAFLEGNDHAKSAKRTWANGLHTIYNHARDRNEFVAEWFSSALIERR